MVTIGVDAHKRVHQAVALDSAWDGLLGSWRGAVSQGVTVKSRWTAWARAMNDAPASDCATCSTTPAGCG